MATTSTTPVPVDPNVIAALKNLQGSGPGQSILFQALWTEYQGQMVMGTPGGGTYHKGNTIYIDPYMLPNAKLADGQPSPFALTYPQLATVIAHELAHALFSTTSYVTAANPSAAVAAGSTTEAIGYLTQYVVALQLGDTSIFNKGPDFPKLKKPLAALGITRSDVSDIGTLSELQSGSFFSAAADVPGTLTAVISGLHISTNDALTYGALWQDVWVMNQYQFSVYNPASATPLSPPAPVRSFWVATPLSDNSIKVTSSTSGDSPTWTFSGTNIPISLNGFSLPTGGTEPAGVTAPAALTTTHATLTFSGSENGGTINLGTYIISAAAGGGAPAETLFFVQSGSGNATLNARNGMDWFMLPGQWSGTVTIVPYKPWLQSFSGTGGIEVGTMLIGGSASALLNRTGANTWTGSDGSGGTCLFTLASGNKMTISDTSWGGGTIDINNFDLQAAEKTGFLGIFLEQKIAAVTITPVDGSTSSSQQINQQQSVYSEDATTPFVPDFVAGTSESCTVSLDAPTEAPQTITFTLSGAPAADFAVDTGSGLTSLSSAGTFTVTVSAGEASASFLLENIADVGGNATLQLGASTPDEADSSDTITGGTITQSYVEPTDNPFAQPASGLLTDLGADTAAGSGNCEVYSYAPSTVSGGTPGGVNAGNGNNFIDIDDAISQSFSGGTGNDTINATFGKETSTGDVDGGTDVINGNGGSDIVYLPAIYSTFNGGQNDTPPSAAVSVFANTQVSLATAIANANAGVATNAQGDLIDAEIAATVVGGNGKDLIFADSNDVVVAGPGNDTIVGGFSGLAGAGTADPAGQIGDVLPGTTWSTSFSNGQLSYGGSINPSGVPGSAPTAGYEGNVDGKNEIASSNNTTIFGGSGNDLILLSNGNNDVQLGTGSSTVLGGMGSNTIVGGNGNNSIVGGGGDDYISTGNGTTYVAGHGGNNTIIGGTGSDTLIAGNDGSHWASAESGNNYVQAGSGNTLIYGSGGNDTLIGGSGNDTIEAGAGNESVIGGSGTELINGGTGNDTIDVGGDGQDTVYAGSGNTTIYGGDGLDHLSGGSGANVIYVGDGGVDGVPTYADAGSGNTTIYGGDGVDQLAGGSGNDVIYAGDGGDTTLASTVYVGSGNTTVYGGNGIDVINGGSGTDVLYAGDGGIDGTATAVNAGAGVATLYGGAGISVLTDSVGGSDELVGGDGTSDMFGIGNDTFVAGTGEALMSGTGNNTYVFNADGGYDEVANAGGTETLDFSYEDDPTDDVIVSAGTLADGALTLEIDDGDTTVLIDGGVTGANVAAINFGDSQSYSLVGLLQLADAAGDVIDTVVSGTNGNLTFDTGNADSLAGGTGQDTISAWGNNDVLSASGSGTAMYAEGSDAALAGGSGSDTLAAFGADSTLTGGLGTETFEVNDTTDVVQARACAVLNTLLTSVSYTLPTNVDVMTLMGAGNLTVYGNTDSTNLITGNSGNDSIIAGSGYDTLVSGGGVDTLVGGQGADTFVINNSNDVIQNTRSNDTVESSVGYVLSQAAAALTLTGSANLAATDDYGYARITGNAGNDTLVGGSGRDTLVAGAGVDTLVAGTGNNTLVINNTADVIQLGSSSGNDTVESSVSYTLQQSLDTLVLTGTGNLAGQGNGDQSNSITGNSGNDTLIAGSGADTLVAGTGTDTLIAGTGQNIFEGRAGDTYVLNAGFGSTRIDLGQGGGTVKFGASISAADLSVTTVVDAKGDFALQISDGASVLTLDDGLSGHLSEFGLPISAPLDFQFADGSQLDFAQLMTVAHVGDVSLGGSYGNLVLNGDANATIRGGSGNDTVIATGADDSIYGGLGNQTLYGLGEGDQLLGGLGADTLYGGQDSTFVASGGDTDIYAGGGSNTYVLTAGATADLNLTTAASGFQTIVLPAGMTLGNFTAVAGSNGDLILRSLTDNTTAIISGFYNETYPGAWWVTDQSGDSQQLLNLMTPPSSGSGSGQDSQYEAKVGALLSDYQASMLATLNRAGTLGGLIEDGGAGHRPPANQINFNGVTVDNLSVVSGSLNVASSESDQFQTVFTQTGTETVTQRTPVYSTGAIPMMLQFLPAGDAFTQAMETDGDSLGSPTTVNGVSGYIVEVPPETYTYLSGYQTTTTTVPVISSFTTETLSFTDYNVTATGDGNLIDATAPFVGTVITGDGNNEQVDLGIDTNTHILGRPSYSPGVPLQLGAFIEVGNGLNDVIQGTGGVDTIAAGLGTDQIEASEGSTIYVPMAGASIDTIHTINAPYYGNGPYPHNTLVLPDGIAPQDLKYRLFDDPDNGSCIQLTYGDSTVLLPFDSSPPSVLAFGAQSYDTNGINYFQFSDGTVLTRAQVLAMAGSAITDVASYDPVVTQTNVQASTGTSAASSYFTVTDASGSPISVYQITNDDAQGAYFTLDGQTYGNGAVFDVAANQLSQLQYVTGPLSSTTQFQVSAFDGWSWGQTQDINLTFDQPEQATGPNQTVTGSSSSPTTLTGGYLGDTLVGASGQDTFDYNVGSGAETLMENAPTNSSSANALRFGTGITASALSGSINADGSLTLSTGATGDSITIEGFNPLNPLGSMPIQQFEFNDGSSLNFAQLLGQIQSSGTEQDVTNANGTTAAYAFNADGGPGGPIYYGKLLDAQGQLLQQYILNSDDSSETDSYSRNADGSYSDTEVQTTAAGAVTTMVSGFDAGGNAVSYLETDPDGSSSDLSWNSQGQKLSEVDTSPDGSSSNTTYSYNADGSYTATDVETPAGGGAATTDVADVDNQGNLISYLQTNPDGSNSYLTWNAQGQKLSEADISADGSSTNTEYAYNADGSYTTTEIEIPGSGSPATTEVASYDSSGNQLNDNSFTPGTNGSYTDEWYKPDGSNGSYWWNSSTGEYQADWKDANGATWTDDYQYASGGSPGSTGVSFTETYSDSAGDQGTRQYDAATGATTVSWYSSATETITGTVTDSGFIGLQNDGELTNTQPDLGFFNPATSPTFQNFLAGH